MIHRLTYLVSANVYVKNFNNSQKEFLATKHIRLIFPTDCISMNLTHLGDDVSIKEVSLDLLEKPSPEELTTVVKTYFRTTKYQLYQIERLYKGLSHPIFAIKIDNKPKYYTLRFFEKNADPNPDFFDRAKDHTRRALVIKNLDRFYPNFEIIDSQTCIIMLQEFKNYPIATFSTREEIFELIALVIEASSSGLLLDYNQNHLLFNHVDKKLLYVDKDYVEEGLEYPKALRLNFSQSLVYLTAENIAFFEEVIAGLESVERSTIHHLLKSSIEMFSKRENPSNNAIKFRKLHEQLLSVISENRT